MPEYTMADYLWKLLPILLVFGGVLGIVPFLVFLERKICAYIQDRVGPNRVGLLGPDGFLEAVVGVPITKKRILGGFFQPLADAIKLITKEDFIPSHAEKFLFTMAPFFALLPPFLAFIVIPVGPDVTLFGQSVMLQVADLNVGVLWILAVASLSAYGVAMGGWASNSKYSLLGGIRATAQMISYEVAMGIVLLSVLMHYDSVSLRDMVGVQSAGLGSWGLWHQPVAFILFVICAFAENNRLPFDLPECEAELVGGYHTEYNSMKFGMFFQGEYIAMLGMGALTTALFLGGWHFPGYAWLKETIGAWVTVFALAAFAAKVMAFVLFQMWVRWTLPRFRYDQLMNLGWKGMIPIALLNLIVTAWINLPKGT
ncbi:MAG: NADH-quinone oxidoreductase subunit NuoH [Planctomycetes bacterium]|nr:NADH-quinone oxidoreductase subunit NuoH [Planctomycetota bacterium]